MSDDLNQKIVLRGREIFEAIANEKPSLFSKGRWISQVMDWCMSNEGFKTQLLRFVDVFPVLNSSEQVVSHLTEYFTGKENKEIPALFRAGAKTAGVGGRLGGAIAGKTIRYNIEQMAGQFIIGENSKTAIKGIKALRKDGFVEVLDVLGEAAVSEKEAEAYQKIYLDLLAQLDQEFAGDPMDWGVAPRIQISVKCTALYSQANPMRFQESVEAILVRLIPIFEKVIAIHGAMCIDMESYANKAIVFEVFRRLRQQFPKYPHLGLVLQAYLHESRDDLAKLLEWMREESLPSAIRVVKGAYWDYETIRAGQNHWTPEVFSHKHETDASFEDCVRMILENSDVCYLQCGSHNIRSIAAVQVLAEELNVPEDRYEFQVLYGMAEPIRKAVLAKTERVRLYCPYGEMVPGMAYLVRRLLENTSNESFLRQTFADEADMERLLQDPKSIPSKNGVDESAGFRNHSTADFTKCETRKAFARAIKAIRGDQCGKTIPLFIGGEDIYNSNTEASVNPNKTTEKLGQICLASPQQINQAIRSAKRTFSQWRDTPTEERAEILCKAANLASDRIFEMAAWQVLEVGKQWNEAHADVCEAIDFLRFYAAEMRKLTEPEALPNVPGEVNLQSYRPRGIAAVIAPWNFPLAISTGMVSAALVAGNTVLYKPSSVSAIIGHQLVELFRDAGLPDGVFHFVPGKGKEIGDHLIMHPDISTIAFTGSLEVGTHIVDVAGPVAPGQSHVKRVIAEMGGKNAIIIDDDADLDEAVPAVLYSAFGFQGQKCSACSRVIVLETIYDRFIERLVEAAKAWKIGPSEKPEFHMGAVVDRGAKNKITKAIELAAEEGTILYQSEIPAEPGHFVPITIVGDIRPEHQIAQEEIFGPVLAVMKVNEFSEALDWANHTNFALTGGVFSRSPEHLDRARNEFRVGNLYLNRGTTGAHVSRQPFGGSKLSGLGTKAGGADYLKHFMDAYVVTENTMRRGFAPETEIASDD